MNDTLKIGLGGGCHWCTEGVFSSIKGVVKVEQGWISATDMPERFSEAVIVHFNPNIISQHDIIEIHLITHSSASGHHLREKYRSAIYVFSKVQFSEAKQFLENFKEKHQLNIITETLHFYAFKMNTPEYLNYFFKQTDAPFCKRYIHPKLTLLSKNYNQHLDLEKLPEFRITEK